MFRLAYSFIALALAIAVSAPGSSAQVDRLYKKKEAQNTEETEDSGDDTMQSMDMKVAPQTYNVVPTEKDDNGKEEDTSTYRAMGTMDATAIPMKTQETSREVTGWHVGDGSPAYTGISGKTGDIVKRIDLETRIMYEISIDEVKDAPCHVMAEGEKPGGGDYIDKHAGNCSELGERLFVSVSRHYGEAMTSLRVCHNGGGIGQVPNRVKGIRVTGHKVKENGELEAQAVQSQDEHPNCKSWKNTVSCADGSVATGLMAHFEDKRGKYNLRGLGLICRPLVQDYG